ncbi:transcription elongation factor GreB [Guyparkeria sp. SCN-R1]|uniref:transcription elongation factor GreB n=1 Tax=Guyparkeria sp. SCN-R1 TaxID=2341113 RepID=UPI000F64F63C|nr:transcription elongation factor GreB [Guyparkeria sp. SCN-R1]RRQ24053.1 transcription elongation factor GreB [Guyparkeria sp. SCN-R1]
MSTPIITRPGFKTLEAELDRLWRVERREVVQAVSEAAALGDRSENAEYIYGKKRLREIDRRIRYLQKRLPNLKVVDRAPDDTDKVYFAAFVEMECETQSLERTLRLVGPDELDPSRGWISIDSPVARKLIGRRPGDVVKLPAGEDKGHLAWEIVDIRYD